MKTKLIARLSLFSIMAISPLALLSCSSQAEITIKSKTNDHLTRQIKIRPAKKIITAPLLNISPATKISDSQWQKYVEAHMDFLKIPSNASEVETEDKKLLQEFPNYTQKNFYYAQSELNQPSNKKVLIYINGGPDVLDYLEAKKSWDQYRQDKTSFPFYKFGLSSYTNSRAYWLRKNKKINDFSIGFSQKNVNTYLWRQAWFSTLPKTAYMSYSFENIVKSIKLGLARLHKVIKKLKNENKQVFLHGSSYGGMFLYAYLARYSNDADGMIVESSPLADNHIMSYLGNSRFPNDGRNDELKISIFQNGRLYQLEDLLDDNMGTIQHATAMLANPYAIKAINPQRNPVWIFNGDQDKILNFYDRINDNKRDLIIEKYLFENKYNILKIKGYLTYLVKNTGHGLAESLVETIYKQMFYTNYKTFTSKSNQVKSL